MTTPYNGPIIDGHHHLWDLSMGRHPWLAPNGGLPGLGDLAYLRHTYLPPHFEADSAGSGITATVCVEALWDPARDPAEEIAWLEQLDRPAPIAARTVARADLARPGAASRLDHLQIHPTVVGIREHVRWHPDPARRASERPPMDDPAWQRGVDLLAGRDLLLELLLYPWQADAVATLAQAHPDLTIVVDHCASPIDRDPAGIDRWRHGLATMAAHPNVHLKVSNFARYLAEPTPAAARDILQPCLDAFGPGRCLWGSDYPVARHIMPYADMLSLFRAAIEPHPIADQAALLHDTAARLYRIG